jgi:hypothetical protein
MNDASVKPIFESMKSLSFKEPWVRHAAERLISLPPEDKLKVIEILRASMRTKQASGTPKPNT